MSKQSTRETGETHASREAATDFRIDLTPGERDFLDAECERSGFSVRSGPLDDEDLLTTAELMGCRLPKRVIRVLRRFRRQGGELGGLVIGNVPLDRVVPPTPGPAYWPDWTEIPVATFTQLAITSVLGDIISYADEKDGRLVQDIVPVKGAEHRQENTGTVPLELHTEDGFHPYKPDFITLLCLRPDHEKAARTLLGAAVQVVPLLSAECIRTLRQPLFRLRASSSFGDRNASVRTPPLPVLSGPADGPEIVADFHAMEPVDSRAQQAFDQLHSALLPLLTGLVLDRGDLLVIDNRAAVHGRTGFDARMDGTDRWLRRCFAVADLRLSRSARAKDSRVCAPLTTIGFPN